jgi:glycosyltransferase involved in cell wall biosynthesis
MQKVSIVIPTYEGVRHLHLAMDSVLSQKGVDLELIVVDDRSGDGTFELARSYSDPRVRVYQNDANLGPEGNWNRALSLATGDYVKLLPQDDTLAPGTLADQVAVLDEDSDEGIALVFGARDIIDDNGRKIARRGLRGVRTGPVSAGCLRRWCVRRGTNVIGEPGAVLFRRSLAQRVGMFDAAQPYVIDLNYWLRLLAHGEGYYLDRTVSTFRVSSGSWSVAIGHRQSRQYSDFVKRMSVRGLLSPHPVDLFVGRIAAIANNWARLAFYKWAVQ